MFSGNKRQGAGKVIASGKEIIHSLRSGLFNRKVLFLLSDGIFSSSMKLVDGDIFSGIVGVFGSSNLLKLSVVFGHITIF